MPKRTKQNNTRHRAKTHGFRARRQAGSLILLRRIFKGRKRLAV